MAKKVNKQKKIDHKGRALHTAKSLFAVCCSLRHTAKTAGQRYLETAFAVCLVKKLTAKPQILP